MLLYTRCRFMHIMPAGVARCMPQLAMGSHILIRPSSSIHHPQNMAGQARECGSSPRYPGEACQGKLGSTAWEVRGTTPCARRRPHSAGLAPWWRWQVGSLWMVHGRGIGVRAPVLILASHCVPTTMSLCNKRELKMHRQWRTYAQTM